ncbi:MAG: peroxiredoxin family protein [Spirochaetia bacterium]
MSSLRRTLLLATAGIVVAGIAVAVVMTMRTAPPPALSTTPSAHAELAASPGPTAAASLEAAADALGFRQTTEADAGVVENLPPDTALMAPSKSMLPVGAVAPDFTLPTATGQKVRLSDYRGKTVLLEFFATWCPHCQAEAQHITRLYPSLPTSDFAVISVNADSEDPASLYAFDRFFHLPWPTLLDPGTPAGSYKQSGGAGPVTRAYGVALYPTFYIIDGKGRVAWRNDREQPDMLLSQKLHDAAGK